MGYYNIYWGGVILLLPLWIRIERVPVDMRFAKDMFFISCVLMSLILFKRKKEIDIKIIVVASYLAFMSFYNQWLITSFATIYQWHGLVLGCLCFIQFYSRLEKKDIGFYLDILSISAIVQALLIAFSRVDINLYYYMVKMFNWGANYSVGSNMIRYLGSLGNPMVSSTFLSITTITLLRKKWFYFLPLSLWAIYLTGSTTGIIGCFAGILAFLTLKVFKAKKPALFTLGNLALLGGIFVYFGHGRLDFLDDNNRFLVWKNSLNMIDGMNILYGKGLGFISDNYSLEYPIIGEPFRHLHNEFLEIFLAFGIIGLLILGVTLFVMFKRANNIIIISTVIAFLTTMITGITLHISATALIGILLVALCFVEGDKDGINNRSTGTKCY